MKSATITCISICIAVFTVAFFIIRLVPYLERPTGGFIGYYTAGKMLLTHQDMTLLYHKTEFLDLTKKLTGLDSEDFYRVQPPTLAFILLPFSVLSISKAKLIWEMFSMLCLLCSLFILRKRFSFNRTESFSLAALAFAFTPLYTNFVWGQIYAFLLLIQTFIFVFWMDKKIYFTSFTIALLLTVKGYGLLYVLLALFQREWRLCIYTLINYFAIVIASSFVIGIDPWLTYFPSLASVITSFPASATFQQNIHSFISWFFVQDEWNVNPIFNFSFVVRPLIFLFIVIGIVFLYWSSRKTSPRHSQLPFMIASILSVLTAPLLYDYHYVLMFIPIISCYKYLSQSSAKNEFIAFGISLFLLSTKIPYNYHIFQNTWLGIFGFPRVYGGIILLWLFYKILKHELSFTANTATISTNIVSTA